MGGSMGDISRGQDQPQTMGQKHGFIQLKGEGIHEESKMTQIDPNSLLARHSVDMSKIPMLDEEPGVGARRANIPNLVGDDGGGSGVTIMQKKKKDNKGGGVKASASGGEGGTEATTGTEDIDAGGAEGALGGAGSFDFSGDVWKGSGEGINWRRT